MDKRKLLEERQRKWQEQKSNDETLLKCQQETRTCAVDSKDVKTRTLAHRSDFDEAQNGFLNRLTDKLSDRIRDEIKREFRETSLLNADENKAREALGDKMDSYLQAELSNYTCRICYELMRSPLHIPILLFPCGHTFCRLCMEKSTSHAKIQLCPYCRTPISSSAVNQSLKDLVDQYLSQSQQAILSLIPS